MPLLTPAGTFAGRRDRQTAEISGSLISTWPANSASKGDGASCSARSRMSTNSNRLETARGGAKLAHGLIYTDDLHDRPLAAIWCGLWFASRFVAPIRRLIAAAQEVSRGNLKVTLPERRGEGDLRRLSTTCDTMTRGDQASARRPW